MGTHSLDWHLLLPVADPSTAAAISAVSALPGTAEHTKMITNTGNVAPLTFIDKQFVQHQGCN